MTLHIPRAALIAFALVAAAGIGVLGTLLLTGEDNPGPSAAATTATPTATATPTVSEETEVRGTLDAYFRANSTGDYEEVCSLFTDAEQDRAAEAHDPGGSGDCPEAFQAEADGLGDSLSDANDIYADAQIDSVTIANDAATAIILYGGGSEPATAELRKVGNRWMIDEEP